jgi:UTP--glucose-1-phosphate uridylyltransferase
MNSFNTDDDTSRIIQKYKNHNIDIQTFNQSKYPRVDKESLLPCPREQTSDKANWYPPGHGDIFDALYNSGLIDKLIAAGKEHLFVSNVDNLGAVVDTNILRYMVDSGSEYLMEVTDKTKADVKGGTVRHTGAELQVAARRWVANPPSLLHSSSTSTATFACLRSPRCPTRTSRTSSR